ncbi:hypothetical protein HLB23_25805 [Nocardia uniformis]|uniref:Uncharacterized protein n=1 Tax=Nocardia uniformis TaxID=53432 RepID=A0A849CHQ9_9NOCA|nr:WXG100 family type VII secretion target [Nocardia uniformis]NNH73231.1 hypothetical protein [Nocardia uniformis]
MKYNYTAVDASSATLQVIVNGMETNLTNIKTLYGQLMADFSGAGAEGYSTVMTTLQNKMDAYDTTLQQVKNAIATTAASDGLMKITDGNQGNKFLSIGM